MLFKDTVNSLLFTGGGGTSLTILYIFSFILFLIVYLKSRSEAYLLQQHSTLERTFGAITLYRIDDFRTKIKGFNMFFNL